MITKRTVLSQIEVTEGGHLQIRFAKQIVEDGKVLMSEYHRTSVECGGDVAAQMGAVNTHLAAMGCAAVATKDCDRIAAIAAADWTQERRDTWAAQKAANAVALGRQGD